MRYYVTLDFKRGPSWSGEVDAKDGIDARINAHREAQSIGFLHPVKKATVREVSQDESAS